MKRVGMITTTPAITAVPSDIMNTHILSKLDGLTLASASCTCSELHSLCSEENLWKNICDSTWPSTTHPRVQRIISTFPSGYHSFFVDSFSTLNVYNERSNIKLKRALSGVNTEFLLAVDVHVGNELLYSKVVEKYTPDPSTSFLRIDVLQDYGKDTDTPPVIQVNHVREQSECIQFLEDKLKLSWIMIDPIRKRAVNLSSQTLVQVNPRRYMSLDYLEVEYATVMASSAAEGGFVKFRVTVTCRIEKLAGELVVIGISMQVEDLGGKMMSGKDSLVILHEAMDRTRRAKREFDEDKKRYEDFIKLRTIYRENKDNTTQLSDAVWIAILSTVYTVFCAFIVFSFVFGYYCVRAGSWIRQQLQLNKSFIDRWNDSLSSFAALW